MAGEDDSKRGASSFYVLLLPANQAFAFEFHRAAESAQPIVIGSGDRCGVRIEGPGVTEQHVRLIPLTRPDRVEIERTSDGTKEAYAAVSVGGVPLRERGRRRILVPHCVIRIGSSHTLVFAPNSTPADLNDQSAAPAPGSAPSLPTRELALRIAAAPARSASAGASAFGGELELGLLGQLGQVSSAVVAIGPRVIVVEGADADRGKSIELTAAHPSATLGRGPDSTLRLNDMGTSRAHVAISFDPIEGIVLVRDLGATQGSFLGAKRLELRRNAVWTPDTMLRLGESTVLGLLLPLALKKKTDTFVADRRGLGTISAPRLEPAGEINADEETPTSSLDEVLPIGAGGTSAAIAAIDPANQTPEREPLYLRRDSSATRDRVILFGGMLLIIGLGIYLIIWLFR